MSTRLNRVATLISEASFPPIVVTLALAACSLGAQSGLGLVIRDWAVAAVFSAGLPTLVLLLLVRGGKADGHQVPARSQRIVPAVFAIASAIIGLIVLLNIGAARPTVELYVAGVALSAALGAVTLRLKVSAHVSILTGAILGLAITTSPWVLPALLLVPVVWWARKALGAHSTFELVIAALLGGVVPPLAIGILWWSASGI
jgi:hypothetical protein